MQSQSFILTEGNTGIIRSDFNIDFIDVDDPYFVKVLTDYSRQQEDINKDFLIGYKELRNGRAIIAHNKKQKDLSFDLSDDGKLIVRSEDANLYSIDENGHLIYGVSTDGIGDMQIGSTFIVS